MMNELVLARMTHASCSALAALLLTAGVGASDSILVSDPGGTGVEQSEPSLVGTGSGAVAVYLDRRSGFEDFRIRAFDASGAGVAGSVPLLEDRLPSMAPYGVELGANQSGDVVVLWGIGGMAGRQVIQVDPLSGALIGSASSVLEDEPGVNAASEVTIDVAPDGSLITFFMAHGLFRARLYSNTFDPLGPSFLVEDNTGGNYVDSVFHDDNSFTLTWTGVEEPYFSVVRAQRFGPDGSPAGMAHELTSAADGVFIDTPALAGRPDGTAMVAWLNTTTAPGIWGQLIDSEGEPDGFPSIIIDASSIHGDPRDLYAREDGAWALVQHKSSGEESASVEILDADMSSTGTNALLLDTAGSKAAWIDSNETIMVVWEEDLLADNTDIMGALVQSETGRLDAVFPLSDEPDGADQTDVVVAGNPAGRFVVGWRDMRNGRPEVCIQMFDEERNPIGSNRVIGSLARGPGGENIELAINEDGDVLLGWSALVDDRYTALVMAFDSNGRALGTATDVTLAGPDLFRDFVLEFRNDRSFLVCWNTSVELPAPGYSELDVHLRAFDSDGAPSGAVTRVNVAHPEFRDHIPAEIVSLPDGRARVYYHAARRESDGDAMQVVSFFSRTSEASGVMFEEETVLYSTTSLAQEASMVADERGCSLAWASITNRTIGVRHYNALHEELDREVFSRANELENPVLSIGPNSVRILTFSERRSVGGQLRHDITLQQYGLYGASIGDPVLLFSLGQALHYPAHGRGPSTGVAGNMLLVGYSAASLTDQGFDILVNTSTVEACLLGDFNCDGSVNGHDLGRVLGFWGMPTTDLTGDGTTDAADLLVVLGNWTG